MLGDKVDNENTDILILEQPPPEQALNNVYNLPTTEKVKNPSWSLGVSNQGNHAPCWVGLDEGPT